MANQVSFNINLRVNGKDVVKSVTMNVNELRQAVDATRTETERFTDSLVQINQRVETFRNMADGVSQLASTLNDLTEESRQYSAAMAAANTMAGKSGEDFANLKTQVSELAKTIPIARDQLANGLYQVISNGVPEDNWIEYLNQSAKASVGGIADLEEVVKVTSTVIKNYGLAWDEAGAIQDKIQLTAKNGVTSFEQMAQALPRVTANAATLGVSINELLATFATLTGVSGNTAEVSTQLAAIFTALVKPSSEATQMAQQMGIQFDAAAVKAAGGMQNFIQNLDRDVKSFAASSGMLEQEIYGKLFGSAESLRALIPLTGELADKFSDNVSAMEDSAGTIDDAFNIMGSTGAAQLQKLKNSFAEIGDTLSGAVGWFQPVLNFGSQAGMTAVSVLALRNAFTGLSLGTKLASAATAVFGPILQVCRATMIGAAVSAETLRLAIRGLMIATGIGIAVAVLTEIINQFASSNDNAANSASRMANAEQQAADSVKSAYNNTLQQTYSSLMSQYDRLKDSYNALKTTHEKTEWLKNNKSAFDDLRIKVNGISDAENIFKNNTTAVAQAFERRAKAAAYAAQLVELYKQQLDLSNRKKTADAAILAATNQYNHSTATSNQDNPYATENAKRNANLAGIAADMKNGGDGNLAKVNEQLNATNKKIEETRKAMNELGEDKIIDGGSVGHGNGNTTATAKGGKTTTHTTSTGTAAETDSINYYEQKISQLQTKLRNSGNTDLGTSIQRQIEGLQRQEYFLKVKMGIESVPAIEVKKSMQTVSEQMQEAYDDMQQYLQDHPLQVDTDPDGTKKMAKQMKNLENIQVLGGTDLTSLESMKNTMNSIIAISDDTSKGFATAGTACTALGNAMQQLGADSAAAKAGLIMAAIGNIVLSFAQAMNSASKNWVTWLAFGISGTATMISMIASISKFATGGIVGGNQTSGDNVLVRVNSGEMILNAAQQARLFALANGAAYQESAQVQSAFARGGVQPLIEVDTAKLQSIGTEMQGSTRSSASGRLRVRGRDLVTVMGNETRGTSRRTGIRIG
jgi:TP901 family phage tail tape measure protein